MATSLARSARSTTRPSAPSKAAAPARKAAKALTPKTTAKSSAKPALRAVKGSASSSSSSTSKRSVPAPAAAPASESAPRVSQIVPRGYVPLVDIPKPPPPPKDFTLAAGDKAVHPAHGLGEVIAVEHRELAGIKGEFYILRILDNGMRVMVPRMAAAAAGLRPVMSAKEADKVLETMRAREVAVDLQPWSRRFRAYTEMIKSGQPHEVAKVLRDMYRLKFDKELSFGERRLLDQAKSLLMRELAAAKGMTEQALKAHVDSMFTA